MDNCLDVEAGRIDMQPSLSPDILARIAPEVSFGDLLGVGGYKSVYSITVNGTQEALKIVKLPQDQNNPQIFEENKQRIQREIKILGLCESPQLVKLGSITPRFENIDNDCYMVYSEELIPGFSVRHLLKVRRSPDFHELKSMMISCLEAVNELSKHNVIHRDIKPDNIIKTEIDVRPFVLLDLGIAFQQGGTLLTSNPSLVPGTLYYIAPEMLESNFRANLDSRADLYALALTIYEYATGANPFAKNAESQFETLTRILKTTPPRLVSIRSDLPLKFCNLIDQCIKKRPALRPSNLPGVMNLLREL